jgi:hypothetical protein
MLNIYINVAVTGNVNTVLNDLLSNIHSSGLYEKCWKVFLVINGDVNQLNFERKKKYFVWNPNKGIDKCEFPTLDLMWSHSQDDDITMLYLHTKGVSRTSNQIKDWVSLLTYFNVNKWSDRLTDLESNDVVGVNLQGNKDDIKEQPSTWGYGKSPIHYSGNFWWSKSSHIRKLKEPSTWCPSNDYIRYRIMCEMWVCSVEGKFLTAHNSGVNHYTTLYPRSLYGE